MYKIDTKKKTAAPVPTLVRLLTKKICFCYSTVPHVDTASWSLVAVILARWGLFKGFWYMGMEHTRHGTGHSLRPSAF
jgi:hypothetical protein